jgi:hypothetical protein
MEARYVFSAKGAAFIAARTAPQGGVSAKTTSAERRFIPALFRSIIGAMAQSLSKVILHIVFSTKNRQPCLDLAIRRACTSDNDLPRFMRRSAFSACSRSQNLGAVPQAAMRPRL